MSKQAVYAAQAAFDSAQAAYEAFRKQHEDVLDEHDHLAVAFTDALEVLKTALRDNAATLGKNFGSFTISVPKEFNADALRDQLGDAADPYLKVKYTVDSKKFEDAVESGAVSRSVADEVIGQGSPRISGGPKPPSIYQR